MSIIVGFELKAFRDVASLLSGNPAAESPTAVMAYIFPPLVPPITSGTPSPVTSAMDVFPSTHVAHTPRGNPGSIVPSRFQAQILPRETASTVPKAISTSLSPSISPILTPAYGCPDGTGNGKFGRRVPLGL